MRTCPLGRVRVIDLDASRPIHSSSLARSRHVRSRLDRPPLKSKEMRLSVTATTLTFKRWRKRKQDDVGGRHQQVGLIPHSLLFLQPPRPRRDRPSTPKPLQRHNLRPSLSGGYLCLSPTIGARNAHGVRAALLPDHMPPAITFPRS